MSVYLLHFVEPYKHAAHYLGWSPELDARVHAHLHGKGARLTQVVKDAGIGMMLARVWEDGDRSLERKLKGRHNGKRLCPICNGLAVQLPLLGWMRAYVPEAEQELPASQVDDHPPDQQDFWQAADTDDYEDDLADREFWRSGAW